MKKIFFSLFALGIACTAMADPTGVAPESGQAYYLYNVGAQMYMNHGSSWGTHVTVDGAGSEITLGGTSGQYTIHHAGIDASKYQTEDGWSDNVTPGKFDFVEAASGVYYLKCSSGKFYKWNGGSGEYGDEAVVADSKEETDAYKWVLVPAAKRTAFEAGNDVTHVIKNPDFTAHVDKPLTSWTTGFGTHNSAQTNFSATFAEKWVASPGTLPALNHSQKITVPAGKYVLTVAANSVQQSNPVVAGTGAYVYAGSAQTELGQSAFYSVEFLSNGGETEIGVKTVSTTANWVSFDKFRLVCVEPAISTLATSAESPVAAAADTWYKLSIPVSGTYVLTTTDGATITYTQAVTALASEVTASAASGDNLDLTAGTLCLKASAATTVTVAPLSFVYELGEATLSVADGKYTQNATYTVTFPSAGSSDPDASVSLVANAKATVNGVETALVSVDKGFSVSLGTLTTSTDYNIVIPADVYGYEGEKMNAAINVTVKTPAVMDGTYYIKTADGRYLSRGNNYNTRAIVDNYGIAVKTVTNVDNITTFQFVDNNLYLFDADAHNLYTDNSNNKNFSVLAVSDGFHIVNENATATSSKGWKLAITTNTDNNYKYDVLQSWSNKAEVFTFEATSAHPAAMIANKNAQAAAVAASLGLSTVETKAGLDALVALMPAKAITVDAKSAGAEVYQNTTDAKQTLSNIPNGLYKVSVKGFQRIMGHAATWAAHEAGYDGPTTSLYANDQEVQMLGMFDQTVLSPTKRHGNDVLYGGNYYPDRIDGAIAAIEAGNYVNEIYVNVTNHSLSFGIYKANKCGNQDWLYYKDFAVTYYGEMTRTTATDFFGTICLPYAFAAEGATLYSAEAGADYITLTEVSTPVAGTPYIYQATADAQSFTYTSGNIVAAPVAAAPLTGVFAATQVPVGSYVLQTKEGVQAFHQVAEGAQPTLSANKAYVTVASEAPVLRIQVGETAIEVLDAMMNGEAKIFDLEGRQQSKLQKGINIVNGVKVIVK